MEATTAGLERHLKKPEYINWVKNALALKFSRDVLNSFVDQHLPVIQQSVIDKLPSEVKCGSCCVSQAPTCPKNICNIIMDEIKARHRLSKPSFCNTNAKNWTKDAWEIAKCFMPPGYQKCRQSDADISAFINIIINCKYFVALVSCDLNQDGNIFCEARTMRNIVMHSGSLTVGKGDLGKNLDLLINLLRCIEKSHQALEQLKKLKTGEFEITLVDVKDTHARNFLAIWEGFDDRKKGESDFKIFIDRAIDELGRAIETDSSVWKAPQHTLIANFVKMCKQSLIKLVQGESETSKPETWLKQHWSFQDFLERMELFPKVRHLLDRHKRLLYPEDGSLSDINKWDIFLLCHVLSLETRENKPDHLKKYVRKLRDKRDKILRDPNSIREEDLKELSRLLNEPLRTELGYIMLDKDITDDETRLQYMLKSWQENEDNMECKQISPGELQQVKIEIKELRNEVDALHTKIDQQYKDPRKVRNNWNAVEGMENIIAYAEIKPTNCDPEDEEKLQDNITSKVDGENIATSQDGWAHFKEETQLNKAVCKKGCIILEVPCESIKELIRFWDICMDGSAVRALSKVRDDYRKFLGCGTLEFDILLTKKEVYRCLNYLVERISSQLQNEGKRLQPKEETCVVLEPVHCNPNEKEQLQKMQCKMASVDSDENIYSVRRGIIYS